MSEQSHPGLITGDAGYQAEHTRSKDVAVVTAEELGESGQPESYCQMVPQGLRPLREGGPGERGPCRPSKASVWELRRVRGWGCLCRGSGRCRGPGRSKEAGVAGAGPAGVPAACGRHRGLDFHVNEMGPLEGSGERVVWPS